MPEAMYVIEEVDRLNGIVSGYLDFARAGGSLLAGDSLQLIDLDELIGSVRKHLADKYGADQITWLADTTGEPLPHLTITSYPRSLRQVILNLFMNAVDAMATGGQLAVSTQYLSENNEVLVSVSDTGTGIDPAILPHIFEPFTTGKEKGTGLGLSISYELVFNHGGRIQAENNPDGGAVFRVWLPVGSRGGK
jgi:signal transduction histidine kinase